MPLVFRGRPAEYKRPGQAWVKEKTGDCGRVGDPRCFCLVSSAKGALRAVDSGLLGSKKAPPRLSGLPASCSADPQCGSTTVLSTSFFLIIIVAQTKTNLHRYSVPNEKKKGVHLTFQPPGRRRRTPTKEEKKELKRWLSLALNFFSHGISLWSS